jgi:glycosyltransferase involved in cell wall biosynthesis
MKIAHLTTVHQSCDMRIFHKECISLKDAGYEVCLLVKEKDQKTIEGVKIIPIVEQKNRLKRLFLASKDAYIKAKATEAKIIHFHDPELMLIGILLSLQNKKVIYDVHEDLPRQILSKHWINPMLRYPVSWCAEGGEWIASRLFFSGIVAATPKIAVRFPRSKTVLVQNFPLLSESIKKERSSWVNRKHQVAYIGGIDTTRGIIENIDALELLSSVNIQMVLAGPFSSKNLEQVCKRKQGWKYIDYFPWLNRKEVMKKLNQSIAGLVVLHPTPAYIDSLPIKMFEYMQAGIPVIASDFPLWREIIDKNHCGILVDPLKPEETANAIKWIIENPKKAEKMGKNGQKAIKEKYNWSQEAEKLVQLYKKLAS